MKKKVDIDPNRIMGLFTKIPPKVLLDSEDRGLLEKVIVPKEGGIKTYVRGFKYPYPGYPHRETAKIIEVVKRTLMLTIRMFKPSKNPFKLIRLRRTIKRFIPLWIDFAIWALRDSQLKPKLYSRPVREIYRLFDIMIKREDNLNLKDKWRKIRDITCMIIEFDQSYRFRIQDVLSELNIDEIKLDKIDKHFCSFGNKSLKDYKFGKK